MTSNITIRPLAARDSFQALSDLLHRAYAPLADQGLNFTAATQAAATTRKRAAEGQCFVAVAGRELVGTVTVCGPYDVETAPWTAEVPWFRERDTAHFHQFAVDPAYQGRGWAAAWCRSAKTGRARAVFAAWRWTRPSRPPNCARCTSVWAMPTSARCSGRARTTAASSCSATWTVRRCANTCRRWPATTCGPRSALQAHVDALPEADYRRDLGLFFHSIHGTLNHLLVGEHLLWFARFAQGGSEVIALDAEAEPDRANWQSACAKARWPGCP
jgi:GNAT superfamily N-acetyltransferase